MFTLPQDHENAEDACAVSANGTCPSGFSFDEDDEHSVAVEVCILGWFVFFLFWTIQNYIFGIQNSLFSWEFSRFQDTKKAWLLIK